MLVLFAILAVPAAFIAARIPTDNAIERMIVESDLDFAATQAFHRVFPEKPTVLLLACSEDPLLPSAVAALRALEGRLARVAGLHPISALTIAERLRPGLTSGARASELRSFLSGTDFFRSQGLLGEGFLGIAIALDAPGPQERDALLARIDAAIAQTGPGLRLRRVGEAFVDAWLERETRAATARYLPLFGVFVVALNLALYRSWRALLAVLLTLGACVLFATAAGGLLGFRHSIVSPLVSLTVMVTAAASLVYLHSRFVACPAGRDVEAHRLFAFANKLPPVSASLFAAAAGFAALGVSGIRPVREMGLWSAIGLALTWLCCFTLFPCLQKILGAPTRGTAAEASGLVGRAAEGIPRWSYRWRHVLVLGAFVSSLAGGVALLGVPGLCAPMPLETDSLDYLPKGTALLEDARFFESRVAGLQSFSLWVVGPPGGVLRPDALAGLDAFATALEGDRSVASVMSLTEMLRLRRYAAGLGEALPRETGALARLSEELEQLLLQEPALQSWVDLRTLGETRLGLLPRGGAPLDVEALGGTVSRLFRRAQDDHEGLRDMHVRLVGQGLLGRKIAGHLVPTLVQSFALTAAVVFLAFVLVFRSGKARLLAMIPSLVAILTMFLLMRLLGIPLNVATILIATTVLGASENDQIHFFWHFLEERRESGTEHALGHAIHVAGGAIFYATLVNASGFLALALSDLPPMRQFGILTSSAFVASMVADFTALPAALWILSGERPKTG